MTARDASLVLQDAAASADVTMPMLARALRMGAQALKDLPAYKHEMKELLDELGATCVREAVCKVRKEKAA